MVRFCGSQPASGFAILWYAEQGDKVMLWVFCSHCLVGDILPIMRTLEIDF